MRPVRLTARLVTIVLLAVALYVRPILIVFVIGGFLLGAGIRYATSDWSRAAPILKRALITLLIGGVGLIPIVAAAGYKPNVVIVSVILIVGWILLPAKIRARARFAATLGLVSIWLGTFVEISSFKYALPKPLEFTRYSVRVDQSDEGNAWTVRSEALFNLPNPPTDFSLMPDELAQSLVECGWTVERDGYVIKATRQRTQGSKSPRIAATSVNTIYLEDERHCGLFLLVIPANSQAAIFAPTFAIAKTYPDSTRSEVLGRHLERFLIPMNFAADESPTLRFEVINPLLQNWAGAKILDGAFWLPLGFIGTIVAAALSNQISGSIVVPLMRRFYRLLGLKWYEEDHKDTDQTKPLIIIP
jgi:hypothetical protein